MTTSTLPSRSERFARYARTVADRRANAERSRESAPSGRRFTVEVDLDQYLEAPRPARPPVELPAVWPMVLALAPTLMAGLGALSFLMSTTSAGQGREVLLLVAYLCVLPAIPLSLVAAPIPLLVRRGNAPGHLMAAAGPGMVLLGALLVLVGGVMSSAAGNVLVFGGAATLLVSPLLAIGGLGALLHHRRTLSLLD